MRAEVSMRMSHFCHESETANGWGMPIYRPVQTRVTELTLFKTGLQLLWNVVNRGGSNMVKQPKSGACQCDSSIYQLKKCLGSLSCAQQDTKGFPPCPEQRPRFQLYVYFITACCFLTDVLSDCPVRDGMVRQVNFTRPGVTLEVLPPGWNS